MWRWRHGPNPRPQWPAHKSDRASLGKPTVSELLEWPDHDLEKQGRLTEPMRYDAASDRYEPVSWQDAFREIGDELNRLDPKSVVFYTSGRASLEASFMYQLFARVYRSSNLPDSSNMCHESTSVGLPESVGSPVGALLILIALKTGLDLRAHLAERRKLAGIAEAAAPA